MGITNRINFRHVRGDVFGGVTAAVIALPKARAFGVVWAISPEQTAMADHEVLIVDPQNVPHLGGTAALAIESPIQDASDARRPVFLVGTWGKTLSRPEKLGVLRFAPPDHPVETCTAALKASLRLLAAQAGLEPPRIAAEPGASAI